MDHGARTASKASGTKKLFAGIAALGLAAGAYGVYATTLSVTGNAGTQLQAGSAAATVTASCDSNGMTVTENWNEAVWSDSTGWSAPTRAGWTVTGIASGCSGKTITLAVNSKAAKVGEEASRFVALTGQVFSSADSNTSLVFTVPVGYAESSGTATTDTVGYSIKVS